MEPRERLLGVGHGRREREGTPHRARAPPGARRTAAATFRQPSQSSTSKPMNCAGISPESLRMRLSAGWRRVCIASKSIAPSISITISPSIAERGGSSSAEGLELREVAQERPAVARPQPQLAADVLEHAAESVPLRLVGPAVAERQLADELGLHRRERDERVELGGAFGRVSHARTVLDDLRSSLHASRRHHRLRRRHPDRPRCPLDLGVGRRRPQRDRLHRELRRERVPGPDRRRGARLRSLGADPGQGGAADGPQRPAGRRCRAGGLGRGGDRGVRPGAGRHPRRLRDRRHRDDRRAAAESSSSAAPTASRRSSSRRRSSTRRAARSRSSSASPARTSRRSRPAPPARPRSARAPRRSCAARPTSSSRAAPRPRSPR